MTPVERLKEELDNQADWNVTITVSRKDLQSLISAYEALKEKTEKR